MQQAAAFILALRAGRRHEPANRSQAPRGRIRCHRSGLSDADQQVLPREIRRHDGSSGRRLGMCALEFSIAESPSAILTADVLLVIEAEPTQPLLLTVSRPKQVVLHGPHTSRVVAVLKIDHRRMTVVHGAYVCQLN